MHRSTRLRDLAFALGIVAAGGMVGTRPCSAVWQQVGGPEPPMVAAIADDGSGLLFLGTDEADAGDLYRSEDGIHWSNLRLPSGGALRIEEHLGKLFLGTYLSGLFYSVDHGDSWQQVGSLGNATIHDFASSGGTMFAVPEAFLGSTLLRSTDGGLSWSGVAGLPQVQVETLDSFGSVLLAGTDGSGILRSTDGGGSWGNGNAGLPGAAIVPVLAGDGSAIYAGVRVQGNAAAFGVYRSTDGGSSWTKASVDLPGSNLADFGALGFHGGELFAGLIATAPIAGVYRSTDGGAHWLAASNGLPDGAAVRALCSTGSFLLAGTDAGAFRTTDAGAHWTESDEGTAAIRGVSSVLSEEDGIFLGLTTNGGIGRGVWRTTDHGASWTGDPREPAQSSEANG
ncbi:MAG: YCF48-related protein, partial [Candidatus Eisenbacteria bacterium]|nr:YCF48-related protein [Candidatus Eisenbacteria bacterium]